MPRKKRGKRPGKGYAALLGLPFLSWSSGLSGHVGKSDDSIALEERLINIDARGVAPRVISVIEKADAARVVGPLDGTTIREVKSTLKCVDRLRVSHNDKVALRTKLRSFIPD